MKIKHIKNLRVSNLTFKVIWDKDRGGGGFDFVEQELTIGTKYPNEVFGILNHELMEMCAANMYVRHPRGDCNGDFIFVFDHRQFDTMMDTFTGLLQQFIDTEVRR